MESALSESLRRIGEAGATEDDAEEQDHQQDEDRCGEGGLQLFPCAGQSPKSKVSGVYTPESVYQTICRYCATKTLSVL